MRMIQRRDRFGFPVKPLRELLLRDFEGDSAVEPRIARFVDVALPAPADRRKDLLRTETSAGGERHCLISLLNSCSAGSLRRCPLGSVAPVVLPAARSRV
jgi:hypothetical protein